MTLGGKRVLYISYNGMLDPLGQSQVIPYLKELSNAGVRFTLLSFERERAYTPEGIAQCRELQHELAGHEIDWHWLRYHKRPSLPATAYDVAMGVRLAGRLVRKHDIQMVHARAHIPAVIALQLKKKFGVKMIFDVRGLMAEEYVDAGHWRAGGTRARITKSMEARALRAANGIVTLTDALWEAMQTWPVRNGGQVAHETIPCCIDLEKFYFDVEQRDQRRTELGVSDRLVLVYSGSIGGWYMTQEMAAFFRALKQENPRAFFLWLTQGSYSIVADAMQSHGPPASDYAVKQLAPAEMPGYLNAADVGIAFYRPGVSRLGTSPVKVSEYLSCGLPVIINAGIGDCDRLLQESGAGIVIRDLQEKNYREAAKAANSLCENSDELRRRTRAVAKHLFDLRQVGAKRYARLYEKVFTS